MPTLFTRIIDGELPSHMIWRDERCVAFLSINPLRQGHTLVVPRAEVDHWLDLEPALLDHCTAVARAVGEAQMEVFRPARIGLMLAGLEVPHCHLHVVPIDGLGDLDFARAARHVDEEELAQTAVRMRNALRHHGYGDHVPEADH